MAGPDTPTASTHSTMIDNKPEPPDTTTHSLSNSTSLAGLSSAVLPPPRLNVGVFSKRKGVRYHRDGQESSATHDETTIDRDDTGVRYSFHVPPFNSIDHVHMHAFNDDPRSLGYYGRIKYRTESWWCRSYDQVMGRLEQLAAGEQQCEVVEGSSGSSSGFLSEERQTPYDATPQGS
ncbi:hypothetical protein BBO99_00000318 [Phytophthora kernoviae]|uniref:HIT domain-containing protein n=2 Tax=Phytophthora kernoviae TaxID=325452 RepID=A0A3R7KQ08_9STRA|nr:hypothetical protein G195_000798 [Phytophthora kernoviae 00238/432]KAG2532872.1 hypothetical protein JM16_000076 [Phytophthora kernoviae]KAG2533616.1 hypothetical protein JM18_000078 [Phytophthora kernoviae]RLN11083.1 hypothetical protein BBI17_000143 [Phytophthora kernoviae]RLN86050.1 hypothetical protein BBO99_00000318 [Phytophthora kernoviae]